jgi:hypothetical protein
MMHKAATFAIAAFAIATLNESLKAQDNSSRVVGTWRVTSFSVRTLDTNEVSYPVGENPIGYEHYSPGGYVVTFLQKRNPQKPAGPIYTDAERAQFHKDLIGGFTGTYTVEGKKLTKHIVAAWRPDWIGSDQVRYIGIDGNKLTEETEPRVDPRTGKKGIAIVTFEKVE